MTSLAPNPKWRAFDDDGTPLTGGKVYFFEAGTSTPKDIFSDFGGTTHTNPVILDANGEADIWYGTGLYKVRLDRANDTTRWTVDNVSPGGSTTAVLQCVNNIAELRALDADSSKIVEVLGYYAPADKGGGLFYWDNTNTDADDAGVTIIPDSSPATGRWVRIFEGDVSIRDFGAVGDYIAAGIVNPTPTNNDGFIQAAYDYAFTNELAVSVPEGAYLLSNFLNVRVSTNGEVSGRIDSNLVWGDINWGVLAPANLDGSCFIWDNSTLVEADVYIRNPGAGDTQDVKFNRMTFYSLGGDTNVGGGILLENDITPTGTEFFFGFNQTFSDCRIVNFSKAIKIGSYNTWSIDDIHFVGCKQIVIAGDGGSTATNINVVNCVVDSCGTSADPFIELDNVIGFVLDRCAFELTSDVQIRKAVNMGLSFVDCYINNASLQSSSEFLTVSSTAGFNLENVTFYRCNSGGSMGDINPIQGANESTFIFYDTVFPEADVILGTDNVTLLQIGKTLIGVSGTGFINKYTDTSFQHTGLAFFLSTKERQIRTLTASSSDDESVSLSASDNANVLRTGKIEVFGNEHSGGAANVDITGGSGTNKGDINLTTSATKQVIVSNTDDSTSGTTGALISGGGIGAAKTIATSGSVIMDTIGGGLEIKEGTDARMGTDTVVNTAITTVANDTITASTRIFLTNQDSTSNTAGALEVESIKTSSPQNFKVRGVGNVGTTTFAWLLIESN